MVLVIIITYNKITETTKQQKKKEKDFMKKKILGMLLGVTLAAGLLAGCGNTKEEKSNQDKTEEDGAQDEDQEEKKDDSASDEKITLSIYAQYADEDTKVPYDYAVEKLAEEYPNVELNLIVQAQDDGETLETLAATGQLPDIFQANTNIINTFRETEQVMQLDDIAKTSGYLDKLYESNEELVYSDDGHIYCFPYAGNEYVLWYYNKAIFEEHNLEIPKTYDELLNCIKVFKENDIVPMALFGQEGWITTAMYDAIATRYVPDGIKALDEKKADIQDEGYVTAAKKLSEFADAGLFQTSVTTTNYDQASEMFLNGEAAMFLNGQWYIPDAEAVLGENVDWMYYPSYDEASYEAGKAALAGGGSTSGYAVNPDGDHPELAAEVAEFIAEKYCEAKVIHRGNPLVALNTGVEPETEFPAMMQKLSDAIPALTSTTKFTWGLTSSTFNESIMTNTQGLVSNQYTADEFIEDVADAMSRME